MTVLMPEQQLYSMRRVERRRVFMNVLIGAMEKIQFRGISLLDLYMTQRMAVDRLKLRVDAVRTRDTLSSADTKIERRPLSAVLGKCAELTESIAVKMEKKITGDSTEGRFEEKVQAVMDRVIRDPAYAEEFLASLLENDAKLGSKLSDALLILGEYAISEIGYTLEGGYNWITEKAAKVIVRKAIKKADDGTLLPRARKVFTRETAVASDIETAVLDVAKFWVKIAEKVGYKGVDAEMVGTDLADMHLLYVRISHQKNLLADCADQSRRKQLEKAISVQERQLAVIMRKDGIPEDAITSLMSEIGSSKKKLSAEQVFHRWMEEAVSIVIVFANLQARPLGNFAPGSLHSATGANPQGQEAIQEIHQTPVTHSIWSGMPMNKRVYLRYDPVHLEHRALVVSQAFHERLADYIDGYFTLTAKSNDEIANTAFREYASHVVVGTLMTCLFVSTILTGGARLLLERKFGLELLSRNRHPYLDPALNETGSLERILKQSIYGGLASAGVKVAVMVIMNWLFRKSQDSKIIEKIKAGGEFPPLVEKVGAKRIVGYKVKIGHTAWHDDGTRVMDFTEDPETGEIRRTRKAMRPYDAAINVVSHSFQRPQIRTVNAEGQDVMVDRHDVIRAIDLWGNPCWAQLEGIDEFGVVKQPDQCPRVIVRNFGPFLGRDKRYRTSDGGINDRLTWDKRQAYGLKRVQKVPGQFEHHRIGRHAATNVSVRVPGKLRVGTWEYCPYKIFDTVSQESEAILVPIAAADFWANNVLKQPFTPLDLGSVFGLGALVLSARDFIPGVTRNANLGKMGTAKLFEILRLGAEGYAYSELGLLGYGAYYIFGQLFKSLGTSRHPINYDTEVTTSAGDTTSLSIQGDGEIGSGHNITGCTGGVVPSSTTVCGTDAKDRIFCNFGNRASPDWRECTMD